MDNHQKHRQTNDSPLRVLLCAPTSLARAGLHQMLEAQPALQIVGEIANAHDLQMAVAEADPDVVVLQTQSLHSDWPETTSLGVPVVLLAESTDSEGVAEAIGGGAQAILAASVTGTELAAAITAAANGLITVSADFAEILRQSVHDGLEEASEMRHAESMRETSVDVEPLTPRELEVLAMIVDGLANKEIAAQLNVSAHTVKFHISSILGKLGASSRTEATAIGLRHGLITI